MDEYFLVLLIPSVHALPIKSEVAGELLRAIDRLRIIPGRVLSDRAAGAHRPVTGVALVRAVSAVLGRFEKRHDDVGLWKIVDRQVAFLVQELHLAALCDRLAAEDDTDSARAGLENQPSFAGQAFRRTDLYALAHWIARAL